MAQDAALLNQARRLDEHALSQIYDRHYAEVYRYVLCRTGQPEVAEDIASETFLRLVETLHQGRTHIFKVRAWLFGVASHIIGDYFRRVPHEHTGFDDDLLSPQSTDGEAEQNLRWQVVRSALRQLTADQQAAMALRFGGGLSVQETADLMGKSPNAVKILQYRAVVALRKLLSEA